MRRIETKKRACITTQIYLPRPSALAEAKIETRRRLRLPRLCSVPVVRAPDPAASTARAVTTAHLALITRSAAARHSAEARAGRTIGRIESYGTESVGDARN